MKKILIVDDDRDVVISLKAILSSKGFIVFEAYSGEEGLEVFNKVNPDIVLLDLMMEQVDTGISVCKKMRAENSNVKIFMLSAVGDEAATTIDVMKVGFNGAISKPVSPDELLHLID
ncbi:MAG: response regulator [Spirochaetes bacterium]|nr:response regulator [Spirochaetota bacterium]